MKAYDHNEGSDAGTDPSSAQSRALDLASWRRKALAHSVAKDDGLVLVWNTLVHHGTVPVAANMCSQALVWAAEANAADLSCRQLPVYEAIEGATEGFHNVCIRQVHKGIAEVGLASKIARQVDKVVLGAEAVGIQEFKKHSPRIVVRKIPQHHCRAAIGLGGVADGRRCRLWAVTACLRSSVIRLASVQTLRFLILLITELTRIVHRPSGVFEESWIGVCSSHSPALLVQAFAFSDIQEGVLHHDGMLGVLVIRHCGFCGVCMECRHCTHRVLFPALVLDPAANCQA
mmetsp:Transcript_31738/g.75683  ORF Transcript_31738/g.75683 Transcript_31738/m.75683 type:complete len:288 (-) Transcript_31738:7-870(-)